MKQKQRFTHQNPTIELLVLAAPLIAMMVSRMAMQFIDFVMVSWMGTDAQAAIGPASIIAFMLSCLGMGVASAVQTFVSQADGRGTPEQAGAYSWQTLYVAGFMLLLSIPAAQSVPYWFPTLASWGGHSATVTTLEMDYLSASMYLVAPATICAGLQGFFNGVQSPRIGLYAVLISTLVNALANCVLMFGMWGVPEMGIAGAAWGTVIGWTTRALILIVAMWLPEFAHAFGTFHGFAPDWKKLKGLIYVGAPASFQWLVEIGSWVMFQVLVIPLFGVAAMAGTGIAVQYLHICFMPAIGIGMALTSQVGFAVGEKDFDKARLRCRTALKVVISYMVTMGVILFVWRGSFIGLFNADPEVIAIGSTILFWVALFQIGDAMAITHMTALRGAGDTRVPAAVMGALSWVFQGVGAYVVALLLPGLGVAGPWGMAAIYILSLGVYLTLRWRAAHWESIELFDHDEEAVVTTEIETPDWPAEPATCALSEPGEVAVTREP
jgi:MATE family multidrug resistance protein